MRAHVEKVEVLGWTKSIVHTRLYAHIEILPKCLGIVYLTQHNECLNQKTGSKNTELPYLRKINH